MQDWPLVADEMATVSANDFMDQNPSQPDSRNQDWQACPPGTLRSLGSELRGREFRHRMTVASAAAAGVFAVAIGVFATLPGPAAPAPVVVPPAVTVADISCREVRSHAKAYLAGGVEGDLRARMDKHLGKCRSCEKFVHDQRQADIKPPCKKPCKQPTPSEAPTIASR